MLSFKTCGVGVESATGWESAMHMPQAARGHEPSGAGGLLFSDDVRDHRVATSFAGDPL